MPLVKTKTKTMAEKRPTPGRFAPLAQVPPIAYFWLVFVFLFTLNLNYEKILPYLYFHGLSRFSKWIVFEKALYVWGLLRDVVATTSQRRRDVVATSSRRRRDVVATSSRRRRDIEGLFEYHPFLNLRYVF